MSILRSVAFRRTRSWWALSSARARFTALGASVLVLGLVATSFIVWNSPANPVTFVAASISKTEIATNKLVAERNSLLSQVIALQKMLAGSKGNLRVTKAQMAAIQQQLYSVQGALDAADSTAAAAAASSAHNKLIASQNRLNAGSPRPPKMVATPAAVAAPTKAEIINPTSRYFGLYTEQAPFNYASFDATATTIGKSPNSVGYFGGWDQSYRGDVVTAAWKRSTLPVLTWESRPIQGGNSSNVEPDYTLPKIIAGGFDAYLHQYAKDIVATGLPLGIRLDHEMNGIWYPWAETDGHGNSINSNNVGDYVKMWQHVHDIFEQEGANDLAVWIWSPNIVNNLPATHKPRAYLAGLYPGDANVDMIGLSGYLRPPYLPENNYTFDYSFGSTLADVRALASKPILLAEIGASETGGHKAAWIKSLFTALAKPENSDIVGFDWFNLAVTTYTEGELATNDWRIDSRPDSLAAFVTGLDIPGGNFALTAK